MEEFKKLGLSQDILDAIESQNILVPTEIQEKAIPLALAGHDIVGGSATGSGKTLAFSAPIIQKLIPGRFPKAIILTPTRELAEQVADAFQSFTGTKKLRVVKVYGGVSINPQINDLRSCDVVVGTPGRMLDHLDRGTINLREVEFLVLDEADRMFDMGFHHDVEKIIGHCPQKRQTFLFSATINAEVGHLIDKYTVKPQKVSVKSYIDASQLKQVYYDVDQRQKFSFLVHLLRNETQKLVMVFCNTRAIVDFVEKNLRTYGIQARAIHGGLSQAQRSRVLGEFHDERVDVLVCTDVAARGLDIKGVSHVYNYDLPNMSEDYVHRIGRTARAGDDGIAISILSNRDYDNFRRVQMNENLEIERLMPPKFEELRVEIIRRGTGRDGRGGSSSRGQGRGREGSSRGRFSRDSRGSSDSRSSGSRESGPGRRGRIHRSRDGDDSRQSSSGGRSSGNHGRSSSFGNRGGRSSGPRQGSSSRSGSSGRSFRR
ncbi:DEAD/DEAH box helicase [archaeon]|jgi:superfamily II DNA/RNA helicase|nr:DEAD/DEAH box helicase [archaeon]